MSLAIVRVLAALLCAALLAAQSRGASGRRRRAFDLGALAFGLFGVGNLLAAFNLAPWLILLLSLAGVGLVIASLATLFLAYRAGELNPQISRARDLMGDERRRLEELRRREAEARERRSGDEE